MPAEMEKKMSPILPTHRVDVHQAQINLVHHAQIPIAEFNTIEFYYNLHGGAPAFLYGNSEETSVRSGGVDSVDFFIMSTHGGVNGPYAAYAMWDDGSQAYATNMRLGDSGRQVKALATFSCDTLRSADNELVNRWQSAFAGGVKIVSGGSELLYDSNTDTIGYDFALLMQDGNSIGTSWLSAAYNDDDSNSSAIANTGE